MSNPQELTLDTGRAIHFLQLDQYLTYEGLLAGYPTQELNQEILERLVAKHTQPEGFGRPYLIKPVQEPLSVSHPLP